MDENSSGDMYSCSQKLDYEQNKQPLEKQNVHKTQKPNEYT